MNKTIHKPMTEQVYLDDCYKKEIDTVVLQSAGNEIILDKTIFYAIGGGQPSDNGSICKGTEEFKVLDIKKVNGEIIHVLDREGLDKGDKVHLKINWERRYKIMRYHTATHVLCSVINEATNARITGNQLSDDKTRIDFDLENFNREKLKEYERKANELIKEARNVDIITLPREEAMKLKGVVKLANVLPPDIDNLRIIDISGIDQQACGGTHLKNTSEIGEIEIIKAENKGKTNRRVTFVLKDIKEE